MLSPNSTANIMSGTKLAIGTVEADATGEGFAKRAEADREVGDELVFGAAAHPRGGTPGKELRVLADIGHQVEELFGPVVNDQALGVGRHQSEMTVTPANAGGPGKRFGSVRLPWVSAFAGFIRERVIALPAVPRAARKNRRPRGTNCA